MLGGELWTGPWAGELEPGAQVQRQGLGVWVVGRQLRGSSAGGWADTCLPVGARKPDTDKPLWLENILQGHFHKELLLSREDVNYSV